MGASIIVDMAHYNIAKAPGTLMTMGIGSCVAVCLYDPINKIGGLAHIMLPHNAANDTSSSGRYADSGIDALIGLLCQNGAVRSGLSAKIIGGASLITPAQRFGITIGKNNLESVKTILADRNIQVVAEDSGGSAGRSVVFYTETGTVEVTVFAQPTKRITLR